MNRRGVLRYIFFASTLFLLGEVLIRFFVTSPSPQISDPAVGFRYRPNSVVFDTQEGGARLRLNSLGLNSPEADSPKRRTRVLVLGDSFTMASQVPRNKNFVENLRVMRPDIEFVNAGRSDAGPLDYPALFDYYAPLLHPDRILVILTPGDIRDTDESLSRIQRGPDGCPEHILPPGRSKGKWQRQVEPLLRQSALLTLLSRRINALYRSHHTKEGDASPRPNSSTKVDLDKNRIEAIAFALRQMQINKPVTVVYIPYIDYGRNRIASVEASSALGARLICEAAKEVGMTAHVLDSMFINAYFQDGQPGHGFANVQIGSGHLNLRGHRIAAKAISDIIATEIPKSD